MSATSSRHMLLSLIYFLSWEGFLPFLFFGCLVEEKGFRFAREFSCIFLSFAILFTPLFKIHISKIIHFVFHTPILLPNLAICKDGLDILGYRIIKVTHKIGYILTLLKHLAVESS